jgi:hypothetical protein
MFKVVLPSNTPLSARGAILFNDESAALMPMISYDVPVTNNANIYLVLVLFCDGKWKTNSFGQQRRSCADCGSEAQVSRNILSTAMPNGELMLTKIALLILSAYRQCSLSL